MVIMRKRICCVLVVLWVICMISSCAEINQYKDLVVKTEFTTEELLTDFDYLWTTLEKEYIFFEILEQKGIDCCSIKAQTRELILRQNPDIYTYYKTLDQMFSQMHYLAHLNVLSPDQYQDVYQLYTANDDANSEWKRVVINKQSNTTYTKLLNNIPLTTGATSSSQARCTYDACRKSVLIRIPSFSGSFIIQDKEYILNYLNALDGKPVEHIIFDITGNTGGSDVYWRNNIVAPFGGTYHWTAWLYVRDTEVIRLFYFGRVPFEPICNLPETHPAPEFVESLNLTHFYYMEEDISSNPELGDNILLAKRWVVIDQNVYSAADSFADFCSKTGWATLVGRRTGGDGVGMEPVLIALPNTGLLVRFSAVAEENVAGQLNAASGTEPVFSSNRFQAPATTVYDLIDRIETN